MSKNFFAAVMIGAALATGTPSVSAAMVEPVGEKTFLYMNTLEVWLTEDMSAVNLRNGSLCLMDRNGNREMTIKNIDDTKDGVGFAVRELRVPGADGVRFWEILADVGAHAKNCGYWVIAEENGAWSLRLTTEDLAAAGYTPQEWHHLNSGSTGGEYILTSAHEYMPPGAQFGYEMRLVEDWKAKLVWDGETRTFVLLPLPLG